MLAKLPPVTRQEEPGRVLLDFPFCSGVWWGKGAQGEEGGQKRGENLEGCQDRRVRSAGGGERPPDVPGSGIPLGKAALIKWKHCLMLSTGKRKREMSRLSLQRGLIILKAEKTDSGGLFVSFPPFILLPT